MSGLVLAVAILVKGSEGRYMLVEVGDMEGRIIVHSGQEPAVKRFNEGPARARAEGKSVVEESLVGSSGSNGVVERTVQEPLRRWKMRGPSCAWPPRRAATVG